MDYFIISQDRQFRQTPVISEQWFTRFDKRAITDGRHHTIPRQMLFKIEPNQKMAFIDILVYPYFLISQQLKNVVHLYEPYLNYKEIILLDSQNKLSQLYYLPILDGIDCLSPKSQLSPGKTKIIQGVIDPGKIKGQSIFRLTGIDGFTVVVARLDLVESILRRPIWGIALTKLETEKSD